MADFLRQLADAAGSGQAFALGVIRDIRGSSPQKRGAKALFFPDGRIVGTLGGGCLEAEIQDRARRALLTGDATTFELVLDHDFGWDDGLICGGRVRGLVLPRAAEAKDIWETVARRERARSWEVRADFSIALAEDPQCDNVLYRERVLPKCELWIAGSGHVAQAVARLATRLDFEVVVFDDRPTFANTDCFPEGAAFRVGAWDTILGSEPLTDRPTFGLIVTRGHQRDALVLARWVGLPFARLGMIGSRRKKRLIFDRFVDDGLASSAELEEVSCPVGLPIGAVSVEEIAISIVAELIRARSEQLGKD